ncbi:13944_t:CDS:1, partial [Entrophospora sp. SA101]
QSIEDFGPCCYYWQFPIERLCGMLLPLVKSKKDPYKNLINNITLFEKFNMMRFYSKFNIVFKDFKEKQRFDFPEHRVYVNDHYDGYEFYSPSKKHQLNNDEFRKLKECYSAIYDMNIKNLN